MAGDFEAFNEQVESHIEPEVVETPRDVEGDTERETDTESSHDTQLSDVEVIGDDNDRIRVSAETSEGTHAERELTVEDTGKILSFLDLTDVRDLEGQSVIVWEDESGSRLEFQTPM